MIELFTSPTPNGYKISIMLEELGIDYEVKHVDLENGEQKEKWFLAINPNGRIPAIIDKANNDLVVFESGAILVYLAETYGKLLPQDSAARYQALSWLFFQAAGIGPMQGQANVFYHYTEEKIPYAIKRYQNETHRLYKVLNKQLQGRDYIAGEFSIADIATFPWVILHDWAGVPDDGMKNLKEWQHRMFNRPATLRGLNVPVPFAEVIKHMAGTTERDAAARSILLTPYGQDKKFSQRARKGNGKNKAA